jgi:hypothetical protein
LKNSKENTGRIVVFKEIGIRNSYTLEASYFRAIPEEVKTESIYKVPRSDYIKYNGLLINTQLIIISEENLIEFGKFFAHTINFCFNRK